MSLKITDDSFILLQLFLQASEGFFSLLVIRLLVFLFGIWSRISLEGNLRHLLWLHLFRAPVMLLPFSRVRLVLILLLDLAPQFVQTLVFEIDFVDAEVLVDFFLQTIVVVLFSILKILGLINLPIP